MEPPAAGSVVLVPFPFSDLSQAKHPPAVVVPHAAREDLILCQVASTPTRIRPGWNSPTPPLLRGRSGASATHDLASSSPLRWGWSGRRCGTFVLRS